jgi:hypothetical protein
MAAGLVALGVTTLIFEIFGLPFRRFFCFSFTDVRAVGYAGSEFNKARSHIMSIGMCELRDYRDGQG